MLKFDETFSFWKLMHMGFQGALTERCYMPVPLKVTFTKELIGFNPLNAFADSIKHGPEDMDETECYVLAARDLVDDYKLFIVGPEDETAYAYDSFMGRIKFVFDAEMFFYVMENASLKNKLAFFRNAELPSIVEANKFLALVDNSLRLSTKDHNRAWTWIQQMVKGKRI